MINLWKNLKLKYQLIFSLSVSALFASAIFYFYSLQIQTSIFTQGFEGNAQKIFETIHLGIEIGLQDENLNAIQRVFDWAKKEPSVGWIALSDSEKEIFANYPNSFSKNFSKLKEELKVSGFQSDFLVLNGPWHSKMENGELFVGFSTKSLREMEKNVAHDISIATIIILLSVIFISLIIAINLSRPLSELSDAAFKIHSGQMETRISSKLVGAELREVGRSFNEMMDRLEETQLNLKHEKEKVDELILNILPPKIADRLKMGEELIADSYQDVAVLFADIVGFTDLARTMNAESLVEILNDIFSRFDDISEKFNLEKIKTIGDNYMLVGGLWKQEEVALDMVHAAKSMLAQLEDVNAQRKLDLKLRIGINSGQVVGGVIGKKKFVFDLWGDAVNIASRMESNSVPGKICISSNFKSKLKDHFSFTSRETINVKGQGPMETFFVN